MDKTYKPGTVGAAITEGNVTFYSPSPDISQPEFSLKGSAIPVTHAWTVASKDGKEKRLGSVLVVGTGDQQQYIKLSLSSRDPTSEDLTTTIARGGVIRVTEKTGSSMLQVLLGAAKKEDDKRHWEQLLNSSIDDLVHLSKSGQSDSTEMRTWELELYEEGPGEQFGRDDCQTCEQTYIPVTVRLSFGPDDQESKACPITLKW